MPQVRTGLEVLLDNPTGLAQKRFGLVTNHTGVDALLRSNIDLFLERFSGGLVAIFGPEHGFLGHAPAGQTVGYFIDEETGLPVYSLYGSTKKPTPEMLKGLDLIIIDLQDIGARFYTYLYTMAYVLEAAAEVGLPVLVLDRPNPIGGLQVEGGTVEPAFSSFVGLYPLPVRHGLTIGEVAGYFNEEFIGPRVGRRAELQVVTMEGWTRGLWFDGTGLPWVPPSPNAPSLEMAALYPGTCFFEGTNLAEGRGTTKPFEVVGAPWINPRALARQLNARGLDGVRFRPVFFVPTFGKYQGETCGGVQIHILDRFSLQPVRVGLKVIEVIREMYPERFAWRQPAADGRYFFDLLAGTAEIRLGLEAGRTVEELMASWEESLPAFLARRQKYLLY